MDGGVAIRLLHWRQANLRATFRPLSWMPLQHLCRPENKTNCQYSHTFEPILSPHYLFFCTNCSTPLLLLLIVAVVVDARVAHARVVASLKTTAVRRKSRAVVERLTVEIRLTTILVLMTKSNMTIKI